MYAEMVIFNTIRGTLSARRLAQNLVGFGSLLTLSVSCYAQTTQPSANPCQQIQATCERAGFTFGKSESGSGLWVDCVSPIVENKPQPPNASLPLPRMDPQVVMACKTSDPDFAARHVAASVGGQAQPIANPCQQIQAICERAGFTFGKSASGTGLWVDCISPIVDGKPQPKEATLPLPQIAPEIGPACKASDPDFAARHVVPASGAAAAPDNEQATGDEFVSGSDTYGWYDDGWNGPGWYIVGAEFRRGIGFGGREGWHNWHHHGSHAHGVGGRGGAHGGGGVHGGGGAHAGGGHHGAGAHADGGHHGGGAHTGGAHAGGGHHGGGHGGGGHKHSDIRLKYDILMLGRLQNGLGFYRFSYNGSNKAYVGVMAQEVQAIMPEAVVRGRDGYLLVNYDRLGLRMEPWDEWLASGQSIPTIAP